MGPLRERLEALLRGTGEEVRALDGREVVIYGAGNAGRAIAQAAARQGFTVRAYLDARADALGEIDGVPCHAPDAAEMRALAAAQVPVLVGVFNFAVDLRPIVQLLRAAGFARVVSFYEARELFDLPPQFWLGPRDFYRTHADEVLCGFDLFQDPTSRQIYHDHVALRMTFDLDLLTAPEQEQHYLPPDLPRPQQPMRLVDGGAYTGDTITLFHANGVELEALAAFEPDPANYEQLCAEAAKARDRIREMILLPCGLDETSAVRVFSAGAGAASSLDAQGSTHVQVVALDEALPTFAPTFIKLDIEGAEPAALRGAQATIERHGPTLAVCVYHAPEHLWTLPTQMRALRSDYRLALRYHQFNGFDLVAYAYRE